jgi:hypothetical protein
MDPIHTALIYAILCAVGHGILLTSTGWTGTRNGIITGGLLLTTGLLSVLGSCCDPIIFSQHSGILAPILTAIYMVLSALLLASAVCVTASRRTMDAAFSLMAFLISLSLILLFSLPVWTIGIWDLIVISLFTILIVTNAGYVGVATDNPPQRWSYPITLATSLIGLFLIIGWAIPGSPPVKDFYTSLAKDNKVLGILVTMLGLAGVLVQRHAALSLYSLGLTWCGVLLVADGVTMFWKSESRVLILCLTSASAALQIYLDGISVKQGVEEHHSVTWRILPHSLLGHRRANQDQGDF